jgi:hypothetical protein
MGLGSEDPAKTYSGSRGQNGTGSRSRGQKAPDHGSRSATLAENISLINWNIRKMLEILAFTFNIQKKGSKERN